LALIGEQGSIVGDLWRPGGQFAPQAKLMEGRNADVVLVSIQTWGSSSCPLVPSDLTLNGSNELSLYQTASYRGCRTDLARSTRSVPLGDIPVAITAPMSLTIGALYGAPITVPIDTSRVDPDQQPPTMIEVSVALVTGGGIGDQREPFGLARYPTSVPSTGDEGWDAVNALLTTVAPDGHATNGFNYSSDARWPAASVNSVTVDEDKVVVDLDHTVWDPYPTSDCNCPPGDVVMQQLVWTLHDTLNTDLPVLLTINGEPAKGIWFYELTGPVAADPELAPQP
jgi:hypothetical protein